MNATTDNQSLLAQRVLSSLQSAQAQVDGIKKRSTRLSLTTLLSSAAAALIAGLTAAMGPLVGEGIPGWRMACTVAALFSFVATIGSGFQQQSKYEERLLQGNQCVGRLKALDIALATGRKSLDELGAEYEDIALNYPDFIK